MRTLSQKEKIIFSSFLISIVLSSFVLIHGHYLAMTFKIPDSGGNYVEGAVGAPRYLNPVLAPGNDIDRDLTAIIFSSLFKQGPDGELVGDLAASYEIGDFGKVVDIRLREDAFWHDGQKLTADDIVFTVKIIQDPAFKSPWRPNFVGIEVEKIEDYYLRFKLKNYYAPFLQNLTFGIIPKHLWQNVSAGQFSLHDLNLKPIGSGPFAFEELQKNKEGDIQSVSLAANKEYYLGRPYLKNFEFIFFKNQTEALENLKQGAIDGINYLPLQLFDEIKDKNSLTIHQLELPRTFVLFLNQNQSTALSDLDVRKALNHATDKNELVAKVLKGQGFAIEGPFPPGVTGYLQEDSPFPFDLEKAKAILENKGWKDEDGDGIREKNGEKLAVGLVTLDWFELKETALLIKEQWQKAGVLVDLTFEDAATLQQTVIRPRQYQSLLFGEILNREPDPFAFWHSSQKTDPGLNIALFDNKKADELLSAARQELDKQLRAEKYQQFNDLLIEGAPAVFLFGQHYLFAAERHVQGLNIEAVNHPSERFNFVHQWYKRTERVWK